MAQQVAPDLHRGDRRSRPMRTGRSRSCQPRRTCGSCVAPAWRPSTVEYRQISGGVLGQTPDRIDAPGDDPAQWTLASRRPGLAGGAGRPRLRLAGDPLGEVQRDPARPRRGRGRSRHGPGEPGRLGPPRGRPGRRPGGRLGRPPPTRTSRSPTGCRCCSTPGCARWSNRAGPSATRRSSPPPRPPASRSTSPAPATSSTDARPTIRPRS